MLNMQDIMETVQMIQDECLDVRTITMGISLVDCADSDIGKACDKVYEKIVRKAERLVPTAPSSSTISSRLIFLFLPCPLLPPGGGSDRRCPRSGRSPFRSCPGGGEMCTPCRP